MPLTKPGASAPQNALAVSTASSIAPSGGIGLVALDEVGVEHLEQRGAQDRPLERRDALERSSRSRGARVSGSSSSAWSAVACASARVKRRGVALEELVERPAGEVVLVEREDGGPALVGSRWRLSARATCRRPSGCRP